MKNHTRLLLTALALLLFVHTAVAAGVDGKWDFVFASDNGDYPSVITIASDGDNVTGQLGETKLKGTFKEGALELKGDLYVPGAGYSAPMTIKGKLAGDKISGDATWDTYELTFNATKAK